MDSSENIYVTGNTTGGLEGNTNSGWEGKRHLPGELLLLRDEVVVFKSLVSSSSFICGEYEP